MKIGIIGIGEIGGTLVTKWSSNGHSVRVANSRGPGCGDHRHRQLLPRYTRSPHRGHRCRYTGKCLGLR
ncbi:NAD(P)-binding domain-containing protein [Hoeflea sp. IMCC20628]|uniref:NAD(P)-binding domain-containing protein n=1 Tax=Hoeflea sp. IMCC20628 TaxID=1620421 RepID=UPI001FDAAC77|nr:NAD(P)-binding domain-containing protein [Hoeflea sp. IMCC20628]